MNSADEIEALKGQISDMASVRYQLCSRISLLLAFMQSDIDEGKVTGTTARLDAMAEARALKNRYI